MAYFIQVGHFHMGLLGHYHVGATEDNALLTQRPKYSKVRTLFSDVPKSPPNSGGDFFVE